MHICYIFQATIWKQNQRNHPLLQNQKFISYQQLQAHKLQRPSENAQYREPPRSIFRRIRSNSFQLLSKKYFSSNLCRNQINFQQTKKTKIIIILSLSIAFLTFRTFYSTSLQPGHCIRDLTHTFTQFINHKLHQDADFAYYFMVIGQLFIDTQLMVFIIFQMFKMDNFFICSFIGLFYGIRAIFLNIQKFPYPVNVYWDEPSFPPSIGVPYGITSDFFYSGHTGMMLFSLLFWSEKQETKYLKYLSMVGFPYIIVLVISSRVHYVADVFAAIFFCLQFYRLTRKYLVQFDMFFSKGYKISIWILEYLDAWLIFVLRLKKNRKEAQRSRV